MDLFTVDTVGEQNLLDQNEYNDSEILYSNTKSLNSKNIAEQQEKDSEEEIHADEEKDEIDDIEENYDYGG